MIRMCMEPPNTTNIWEAAEDALSLSYQVGTEVLLLYNGVILRVKDQRDSPADIFNAYKRQETSNVHSIR